MSAIQSRPGGQSGPTSSLNSPAVKAAGGFSEATHPHLGDDAAIRGSGPASPRPNGGVGSNREARLAATGNTDWLPFVKACLFAPRRSSWLSGGGATLGGAA